VASLRHLLLPESVAVIGAGRRRGSVGREILHNIVSGSFAGPVYPVNPRGRAMEGLTCLAAPADLPPGVDLAIIAVPPGEVPAAAEACGRRGVRALIVITASLGGGGADLLAICRRYGMRLVGPNCFGVASAPARLNATFATTTPEPGTAGLVMQSAGVGIAMLEHLRRLGIGVSSFASVGDKYDVSSNDMLTWWEQDELTTLAVLYVESFGNPRGFARTARRVGRRLPVLTVIGGRSAAGQRAAASHTAATATPLVTQEALFGQAGIIATHSLGELIEATAFLSCQALPAGRRVAIVSSAGGAGVLAADACGDAGLAVATLGATTQRRLSRLLPPGATVAGPVDASATVSVNAFRACLETVAADDGVDAVLAIGVPTAVADLSVAILSARLAKPLAAALLDQAEAVRLLPAGTASDALPRPRVPVYSYPESAAAALAHAVRYREWRDAELGQVPDLGDFEADKARALISSFLLANPGGGWLAAADAAAMLASYQIQVTTTLGAQGHDEGPGEAVAASRVAGGVEASVAVVQEPVFGPLVVFGIGGIAAEVLGDRTARLAPLTDTDAAQMISGVRAAPLLLGRGASAAVDAEALAGLLLRVSRLADDLPEVAQLELNPVIAAPDGARVAAVRIRVAPAAPRDPFLRQLR
jgi:acyl-CoA synthetase (NDP forming)